MINGIDNIYYFVADVSAAVHFYKNILGLKLVDQDEYWATLDIGGVRLGLHKSSPNEFSRSSENRAGATLTLNVTDIDEAYDYYIKKGVKFLGEISRSPWGYYSLGKSFEIAKNLNFGVVLGYNHFDEEDKTGDSYFHYMASLTKAMNDFEVGVHYTDAVDRDYVPGQSVDRNVIFSLGYSL